MTTHKTSKKPIHQSLILVSYSLTIACGVTGLIIYVANSNNTYVQWSALAHTLLGVALTLPFFTYFYHHFILTIGFRRPSLTASGLLLFIFFLCFTVTGWHILYFGQIERYRWILTLHISSTFLFFISLLLHIFSHIITLQKNRKILADKKIPSFQTSTYKTIAAVTLLTLLSICIASIAYEHYTYQYSQESSSKNYDYSYGPNPFQPSETKSANNKFIDKRLIAKSHRCITCHNDIGSQWLASVHKQSASDPAYVTNINLLVKQKGISSTRYCEGCHAPIALLSGELSPGGQHGGIEGTLANIEGVSCLSCHSITNVLHLNGVAAYQFTPHKPYLFSESKNKVLQLLHDHLLRMRPYQHRQDMGNSVLKKPRFCSTCHTQFMDKNMNDWGWVKMQDEYTAWTQSPFSKHHDETFSSKNTTTCQDCHMPLVPSNDPSSNKDKLVRSHNFPGANTFLPILANDQKQLHNVIEFMQENKMRVSIVSPERLDTPQNLQSIDESIRGVNETPIFYYLEEIAKIQIVVSNQGVGHNFPAGSIDLGEAWLEFIVVDTENTLIYSEGVLDKNNNVDPKAYFYRSLPVDRNGHLVWKHDLFNMVGTSFKRIIKSGQSDIINLKFKVPSWAKSPMTIKATLKYRKLNEKYAKWALKDKYIPVPIVDIAWDSLQLEIKIRKQIESH